MLSIFFEPQQPALEVNTWVNSRSGWLLDPFVKISGIYRYQSKRLRSESGNSSAKIDEKSDVYDMPDHAVTTGEVVVPYHSTCAAIVLIISLDKRARRLYADHFTPSHPFYVFLLPTYNEHTTFQHLIYTFCY